MELQGGKRGEKWSCKAAKGEAKWSCRAAKGERNGAARRQKRRQNGAAGHRAWPEKLGRCSGVPSNRRKALRRPFPQRLRCQQVHQVSHEAVPTVSNRAPLPQKVRCGCSCAGFLHVALAIRRGYCLQQRGTHQSSIWASLQQAFIVDDASATCLMAGCGWGNRSM